VLLLLAGQVHAAGLTGLDTPALGGGLVDPTTRSALGMVENPAAARLSSSAFALDIGLISTALTVELDGADEAVTNRGTTPVPTVAIAGPVGGWGMGFTLMVPFARSGDNDPEGPLAEHSVRGGILVVEGDLCLAAPLPGGISLGVAARGAFIRLESVKAVDTGALIASLSEADSSTLSDDPFLQGTQSLHPAPGGGGGFALGGLIERPSGWGGALWYRSPLWGSTRGPFTYAPSDSLTVELQGTITTPITMPWSVGGALVVPVGAVSITPRMGYVRWSSWATLVGAVSETELGASDALLDAILGSAGLDVAGLIGDTVVTGNRTHDVITAGVSIDHPIQGDWDATWGLHWSPAAVPDATVHPANLDFASLDVRGVLNWQTARRTGLAVTADVFLAPTRVITTSELSEDNSQAGGERRPSGNGTYSISAARLGLTWVQGRSD